MKMQLNTYHALGEYTSYSQFIYKWIHLSQWSRLLPFWHVSCNKLWVFFYNAIDLVFLFMIHISINSLFKKILYTLSHQPVYDTCFYSVCINLFVDTLVWTFWDCTLIIFNVSSSPTTVLHMNGEWKHITSLEQIQCIFASCSAVQKFVIQSIHYQDLCF